MSFEVVERLGCLVALRALETDRRADVTQDEGAYDRFLDQDDWYARGLARERERLLRAKRNARN